MTLLDIDPNVVKPGWTPLIILILLAIVMVLLFVSMRRQFRKINVPDAGPSDSGETTPAPTIKRD
jgi:biopolymer transport protein ExbD